MALTQVSTGGIKDGQVHTADLADAQITAGKLHADALDHTYTLGASGTDHYTFTGEGLTGAVNDATLYLTRGKTYRFVNGNSSGAHPFRIQSVAGAGGTEYNTGVTNNAGGGGSTIIFEVPHDAPDVLYYICTSHANMNGIFYVTGALANGSVTTAKIADDAVDADKIANSINTAIAANTAKTTNATHTGEVTGSTALTIADDVVDEANLKVSNSPTNGYMLTAQSGNTGGLTWAAAPSGVGGATGVAFNDNVKAEFGTGNDFEMFHDGTNSNINNGTGTFKIGCSNNIEINTFDGHNAAKFINDGAVELYHNNSKKVETTSYGFDIINTSSPQTGASSSGRNLVISGGGSTGMTIHTDSNTSTCSILFSDPDHTYPGAVQYLHQHNQLRLYVNANYSAPVMQFNSDLTIYFQNDIYSNGGAYSTGSDLRMKSNLVRFTDTLQKLKEITGYKFDIKCSGGDKTRKSGGVIAQDVEKVYPDFIQENPETGMKSLEYNTLIGVLVEAVKELTIKVEALEAA